MSTLVLKTTEIQKLVAAGNTFEVRDEAGKLVGRYKRVDGPPAPPPGHETVGEWPSEEELERRYREDRRYSSEEVLDSLRKLREERRRK